MRAENGRKKLLSKQSLKEEYAILQTESKKRYTEHREENRDRPAGGMVMIFLSPHFGEGAEMK